MRALVDDDDELVFSRRMPQRQLNPTQILLTVGVVSFFADSMDKHDKNL